MAADHFDFMQHGINHVAAQAAREGNTPMGYRCQPPSEPRKPSLPEHHRRESMERAFHAVGRLNGLKGMFRLGPDSYHQREQWEQWELTLGVYAQGALEQGLKAVIAAQGRAYARAHELTGLAAQTQRYVPDLALHSDLEAITISAPDTIYSTPDLKVDTYELMESVRRDMAQLFAICARKADFDP